MAALSGSATSAQNCEKSGLASPPTAVTFAAVESDTSSTSGVVVYANCTETVFVADTTTIESNLQVRGKNIVHVVSYPRVTKLCVCVL